MTERSDNLDDIDRVILKILSENPRVPYSDIADQLDAEGYEMSSEGIRYRVSKLFEYSTLFMLTDPKGQGWEMLRLIITVEDEPDAKRTVAEDLIDMSIWLVCRGVGTFDVFAVATVGSNSHADDLIGQVRSHDLVDTVEYSIETARGSNLDNYLSL